MDRTHKSIITGGLIGLVVAGVLALPSVLPAAIADDEPVRTMLKTANEIFPPAFSGDVFVKPPRYITEPYVSTEIIKEQTVRKIGMGKTSFVRIMTTASGTYSSDGLDDPHIRYPGIHPNPEFDEWERNGGFMLLGEGGKWVIFSGKGNSIVNSIPLNGGGRLTIYEDGSTCTHIGAARYC